MATTAADIAARLGLQPFETFARAARSATRRHGSTTRAVCEALALAADGEAVVFVAADASHAGSIRMQIEQWARDIDINAALVRVVSAKRACAAFRGRREWCVVDHFVYDRSNLSEASTRAALDAIATQR